MKSIQSFSRKMKVFLKAVFFIVPIWVAIYWAFHETFLHLGFSPYALYQEHVNLTPLSKSLAFLASMIPVGIVLIMVRALIRLFENYENGDLFSIKNFKIFRALGFSLIALVFGNVLFSILASTAVSLYSPKRFLIVDFGPTELIHLVTGVFILFISHIMLEARRIDQENQHTI